MKYEYRKFKSYGEFTEFLNQNGDTDRNLQGWQDVGGRDGIDIRAIFFQHKNNWPYKQEQQPLPEA